MSEQVSKETQEESDRRTPVIEWVFGAVSATLVAGLVFFLGYQALFGDARPPHLEVSIERIERIDNGVVVIIAIANRGDEAASAVTVYASAPDISGSALQKQVEFDFVAAHSKRRGAFMFSESVTTDDLHIEVGGYTEP